MATFYSEDEMKAATMSIKIKAPKINSNVRDLSCIVTFPRGTSDNRLTRPSVEVIMKREWSELFDHVISFGNIDFSRKWVFKFDTIQNVEKAVAKELFINGNRVKTDHATRKFNILKVDWVPIWTDLDDLAEIIKNINGTSGQFVDIRWGRGDKITKDSTQAILRFYKDPNNPFNPPQYIHYNDEYGARIFLHLTVIGQSAKCMKCNQEGHTISDCAFRWCKPCGKLVDKEGHICFVKPRNMHDHVAREEFSPKINHEAEFEKEARSKATSELNKILSSKQKEANATSKSLNSLVKDDEEYVSKQVILGKNGEAKQRTPPSISSSNQAKHHKFFPSSQSIEDWASSSSSLDAWKTNKINFSNSNDERNNISSLSQKLSPINDLNEYPPFEKVNSPGKHISSTPINNLSKNLSKEANKNASIDLFSNQSNISNFKPSNIEEEEIKSEECIEATKHPSDSSNFEDEIVKEIEAEVEKVTNIGRVEKDFFNGSSYFDDPFPSKDKSKNNTTYY